MADLSLEDLDFSDLNNQSNNDNSKGLSFDALLNLIAPSLTPVSLNPVSFSTIPNNLTKMSATPNNSTNISSSDLSVSLSTISPRNKNWFPILETASSKLLILREPFPLSSQEVKELWQTPLIKNPRFMLYGKECTMHRQMGFFSNQSEGYQFSNQTTEVRFLNPLHQKLINLVESYTAEVYPDRLNQFNGLLFNLYQNGSDYISAHSDKEIELSSIGVVCLSLGVGRKFRIRTKQPININGQAIPMGKIILDHVTSNLELLWMSGDFQKEFTHEIPIEKKVTEPRLSITFRYHRS